MISGICSLLLYLGTVIWGLFLDLTKKQPNERQGKIYVLWLYIFLCFGYMTGSDWRNYEEIYTTGMALERFKREPISYFLFAYCPKVLQDFFIFMAIIKCGYLFSFIKLVSSITDKWKSCTGLMIMGALSFFLIESPLRYTLGIMFVNFALLLAYKKMIGEQVVSYYPKLIILLVCSVLCHNSCVFFLIFVPLLPLTRGIVKVEKYIMILIYLLVAFLANNMTFLSSIVEQWQAYMNISRLNDYSLYEISDNANFFAIGNLFRIVFFIFVVLTRDVVVNNSKNGAVLYNITVFYCFIVRFFIIIPTGHRIPMPFSTFYFIYVLYMFILEKKYSRIIFAYIFLSFIVNTWNGFSLIPYSNSIPYIVVGHKPAHERYYHNFYEYEKRVGHKHDNYYKYNSY